MNPANGEDNYKYGLSEISLKLYKDKLLTG